jgi:maltose O-acetyltransferase
MKKFLKRLINRIRGEQNLDKLIKRGLVVGKNLKIMDGVFIDPSHCWHIKIGNNVSIASKVHILAHDASTKLSLGYTRVSNVTIGDNVFIGVGTIILPGVTIGNNVVIGVGSVVSRDIPDNSIAVGNPARVVRSFDDYLNREKGRMKENNVFGDEYTLRNPNFGEAERAEMIKAVEESGWLYVK